MNINDHFRKRWKVYAVVIPTFLFALFVWPTLYTFRSERGTLMRINRITQSVDFLSTTGWHSWSIQDGHGPAPRLAVPQEDLSKIVVTPNVEAPSFDYEPLYAKVKVKNGTQRRLGKIWFKIHYQPRGGKELSEDCPILDSTFYGAQGSMPGLSTEASVERDNSSYRHPDGTHGMEWWVTLEAAEWKEQ